MIDKRMETIDEPADGGVWISCADLAKRKGISRQAATKRVKALEDAGRITTRREGRSRLVDLVEYDRAVDEVGDAAREQAAETVRGKSQTSSRHRDAQAEAAVYTARLKALDLAEREGKLLPLAGEHGVETASAAIGQILARELDNLPRRADDVATAVSKDGVAGARRVLKDFAVKLRSQMAAEFAKLAAAGNDAERDGPIETLLPDE